MPNAIPLIRAGSLAPLVKWLEARGRAVDAALAEAGVACDPVSAPDLLIPMRAVLTMLREASEREACPDLGWRIVGPSSVSDLGLIGQLALVESSPAEALMRASAVIGNFCSHQRFDLAETPTGAALSVRYTLEIDPAAQHQAQLFALGLIHSLLLKFARPGQPVFETVRIAPHPVLGLSHLPAWITAIATASADGAVVMGINRALLVSPLRARAAARPAPQGVEAWERLAGAELGFAEVIRKLIADALQTGRPSAEVMAGNAGVTLRTLQRRLAAEGTSFRGLVDAARRDLALAQIAEGTQPIASVSDGLGYSNPAALSRAVRRWTDQSPRVLRRKPGG